MPDMMLTIPAIEKLLDYAASGIGAIAGPILAPWKASREAKARLAAAPVEAQARRIEAESEAETSVIIAKARAEAREYLVAPDDEVHGTAEFTRRDIIHRIEFQERKRLANVRSVVDAAADELGDKEVNDHEPDADWTARFFNEVQDVSSEDMQKIWARILAGEVESPGRTTLRTLDTLRNMTKRDAEIFRDICDFVVGGELVFYDRKYMQDYNALRYDNLLHIQECGLINTGPFLQKTFTWNNAKELVWMCQSSTLVITRNPGAEDVLKIPSAILTTAGKELFRVAVSVLHPEYLQPLSAFLKSKSCELFYLEGVMPLPDGMIRYTNRIPIELQPEKVDGATP